MVRKTHVTAGLVMDKPPDIWLVKKMPPATLVVGMPPVTIGATALARLGDVEKAGV